ncbi:MAG TPA: CDF family Co(II)/Ni(II) efflux transporter DmeF [Lichenihabitans sp.]|jgi:cation diffusion facilitator family transporter|nr:CDF family Co(II)/Ni(II) efflux transporter DmeF [Lichenihabitans sp.]
MTNLQSAAPAEGHSHVFLGAGHDRNERRTWAVIWLCAVMMVAEIVGGGLFGSLALVADGLHMSTHAGALLLAALAYTYARRHANDPRFAFGTGKVGDLAGFSSAIILAMIALLIGYEGIDRLLHPVPISFAEAIPIAGLGLLVNAGSAWLLGGGHHRHGHGHAHADHDHDHASEAHRIDTGRGVLELEIVENGVPPRFRLRSEGGCVLAADQVSIETVRADGSRQAFAFAERGGVLDSVEAIPEPHAFTALVRLRADDGHVEDHSVVFDEHDHGGHAGGHEHDNNMRAAFIHVLADAAVSVLVIVGLLFARYFGWLWMDPLAGIVGAIVIASWSYGLLRDTGGILLDRTPDPALAETLRRTIEADGDRLTDLHLWRLGPGHLGAIVALVTSKPRGPDYYRRRLAGFPALSHLTVEVRGDGV